MVRKEDAQVINPNEWVLAGAGSQGESYNHTTDNRKMLKLFNENINPDAIIEEINLSRAIRDAGVVCPAPGQLVKWGNRYGIIFERILNKKSFCRAIGDDPSCVDDMAIRMARMALELHGKSAEGTIFRSVLDYYEKSLWGLTTIPESERTKIQQALDEVAKDDRRTLLHGDFHFGNVITDGENDYFIDLGAFAYGNPDFDNSMCYFVCNLATDEWLKNEYHVTRADASRFWLIYKQTYYGSDCPTDEQLRKRYLPYLLIRTVFFERDKGNNELLRYFRNMILAEMEG